MQSDAAHATGKRVNEACGSSQHYAVALQKLQRLLPSLRPQQKGSIDTETRLALLVEAWCQPASVKARVAAEDRAHITQKTKSVSPSAKSRFKKEVGEMWDMVTHAAADERDDVEAFVLKLASSVGRAELIALYGAQFESENGGAAMKAEPKSDVIQGARTKGHDEPRCGPMD